MSAKENQHFIPKFYLRRFSWGNNGKQIGVFNKETSLFFERAKLKSQAYKKNFYGKNKKVEDALGVLEARAAKLFRKVEREGFVPSGSDIEFFDLLYFTILTDLRNPIISKNIHLSRKIFIDDLYGKESQKSIFFSTLYDQIDDNVELALSGIEVALEVSLDLSLKLIVNCTSIPFITSDYPVVKYNQYLEKRKSLRGITGYGCVGLQVFYPISPTSMLFFFDATSYKVGDKKQTSINITKESDIKQLNILQFLNCSQIVYFNDKMIKLELEDYLLKSTKLKSANEVQFSKHKLIDGYSKTEKEGELIVIGTSECKILLNIEHIKEKKAAKKRIIDVGKLQARKKAVEVLNREHKKEF